MGEGTAIEWADHTFNAWEGCHKVSPGCDNCYAETRNCRFHGGQHWGPPAKTERLARSEAYWREPAKWNRAAAAAGRVDRVFCSSLADVFEAHPGVDVHRARLWDVIRETDNLVWMLLTKRPELIAHYLPDDLSGHPRIWLGTTVENQEYAERRIPHLIKNQAALSFLSCEPLLGPVDLGLFGTMPASWGAGYHRPLYDAIGWIIVGGESGPNARPMHPNWARSIRGQAINARVPFHFKQWGEWVPCGMVEDETAYPMTDLEGTIMCRVGKHAAGRLLDGTQHDDVPEVWI